MQYFRYKIQGTRYKKNNRNIAYIAKVDIQLTPNHLHFETCILYLASCI